MRPCLKICFAILRRLARGPPKTLAQRYGSPSTAARSRDRLPLATRRRSQSDRAAPRTGVPKQSPLSCGLHSTCGPASLAPLANLHSTLAPAQAQARALRLPFLCIRDAISAYLLRHERSIVNLPPEISYQLRCVCRQTSELCRESLRLRRVLVRCYGRRRRLSLLLSEDLLLL